MNKNIFTDNLLKGKTALITGGSSGVNKGIAERFVDYGANVVVVARNPERLEAACTEINARAAGNCIGFTADVRSLEQMEAAASAGVHKFGNYDIVIAGAAGNFLAHAETMSANAFAAVVDIDLKGSFHTFRSCYQYLNARASLIAISAPQSRLPCYYQAHVCAAKAGVEMLVRTLAVEWGGVDGPRVNGLIPGFVAGTVGADVMTGTKELDSGGFLENLPVPRAMHPHDVGNMAVMMSSPIAEFMTGHIVLCDGGAGLVGPEQLTIPDRI